MKNQKTTSTDIWGVLIILVAIVAGFFVANALYTWEKTSRARVAASSVAKPIAAPEAGKPSQLTPPSNEQARGKATEASPTTSVPAGKAPAVSPREEVSPPKQETTATTTNTAAPTTSPSQVSFRQDVLPILQKNCAFCHGTMGGLDLKDYKAFMTTGTNKPQVIPGKPQDSLLIKRMEQKPIMPPSGALPGPDLDKIKQWIAEGAKDN